MVKAANRETAHHRSQVAICMSNTVQSLNTHHQLSRILCGITYFIGTDSSNVGLEVSALCDFV